MRLAAPRSLAALILATAAVPAATRAQGVAEKSAATVAPRAIERIPVSWKGDEGLVVGQLAGTWDFGVATMGGDGITTGMAVKGGGGRPAGNGLFRGLVLFTRREGGVTLSGAYASVGGMDRRLPIGRKFDAKRLLKALQDYEITNLSAAATHYRMMKSSGAAGDFSYAIRNIVVGSTAV